MLSLDAVAADDEGLLTLLKTIQKDIADEDGSFRTLFLFFDEENQAGGEDGGR